MDSTKIIFRFHFYQHELSYIRIDGTNQSIDLAQSQCTSSHSAVDISTISICPRKSPPKNAVPVCGERRRHRRIRFTPRRCAQRLLQRLHPQRPKWWFRGTGRLREPGRHLDTSPAPWVDEGGGPRTGPDSPVPRVDEGGASRLSPRLFSLPRLPEFLVSRESRADPAHP